MLKKIENKFLVVGGGLAGCSVARILKDRGHNVSIIEKRDEIGGLCKTQINKYGLMYEPFGAHTFHTKNQKIIDFVQRFDGFNSYEHRKGMIINDKLFPFPITKEAINNLETKDEIFEELNNRPKEINKINFETACISIFGKILYKLFIENYTIKMWGIKPKELTAEWVPKRLEIRNDDVNGLFAEQWQGLPTRGYSVWLERMIEGISCKLNTKWFKSKSYDLVIYSGQIDELINFKFGRLKYRSLKFIYRNNEYWENDNYGTINLPQHEKYIRKCNFKLLHKQISKHNLIQYQIPINCSSKDIPMYPINTNDNNELFNKYLMEICKMDNICPIGRLGLYKYLDMDKAIEVSFDMVNLIENYLNLNYIERYNEINKIRNRY